VTLSSRTSGKGAEMCMLMVVISYGHPFVLLIQVWSLGEEILVKFPYFMLSIEIMSQEEMKYINVFK
jgi:hypothetical protein